MPFSELFGQMVTTAEAREAVSDRAWLRAMLDAEAALASAEARVGVIPQEAATVIRQACDAGRFDAGAIGAGAGDAANPVVPLVDALRNTVPADVRRYVHYGATSQDILDTAAMLVTRDASGIVLRELDGAADACAGLAELHGSTVMPGRTLLQQAVPITFGLKAAGWLTGIIEASDGVRRVHDTRLAAQFGGAAGTLASLGDRGPDVLREFAAELGLAEPDLPWHTNRVRIGEVASALAVAAGALGKVAGDISLLMQTEVAEVREPAGDGRGRSSTMPQKRNPVAMTAVASAARQVHGLASTLLGAMAHEHERAAGEWQAEWEPLSNALALTAGAAHHARVTLEGLEVDTERMRANIEAGGGFIMAEHVSAALGERIGADQAKPLVAEIARRAAAEGMTLHEALLADATVRQQLAEADIDALLEPRNYLGASSVFIDRALRAYRGRRRG